MNEMNTAWILFKEALPEGYEPFEVHYNLDGQCRIFSRSKEKKGTNKEYHCWVAQLEGVDAAMDMAKFFTHKLGLERKENEN